MAPPMVEQLKRVAASSISRHESDIKSFRKLAEGGFNRVFEISMKDGKQVLARLPYASTVPKRLTVASEVATLDFVRSHDVPVPKVLRYSANSENSVGAEYIIMEKIAGDPIGDSWYSLSDEQRLRVLEELVKLEAKLFAIDLPASGGLYYSGDLPLGVERAAIRPSQALENSAGRGEICVGPDILRRWWFGERGSLNGINRGPHFNATECLTAVAEKELAWLRSYGKPRFPFDREYREATKYQKSDPKEYISTLEKYLKIAPFLVPKDKSLHRPTLRHPNLQPNNILVSKNMDIVGLIDWHHCSAIPLFLAANIPQCIQNFGDEESDRLIPPTPPENLDQMSPDERENALEQYRRRHVHFNYLKFTKLYNPSHIHALSYDGCDLLKPKTFTHAGDPWEGNNAQLKADLVHIVQNWAKVIAESDIPAQGTSPPDSTVPDCPISFDPSEADEALHIEKEIEEIDSSIAQIRGAIGIGADGWTPNELFDNTVAQLDKVKKMSIDSLDNKFEQEMAEKHWPFDDFDEDE
ncbi:hypothetical protein FQN54_008508 [Arachnomyces sp. PD_36]|nr:hypothetical protein FQN54_008508 [Arachnomyces sp. PD_36]